MENLFKIIEILKKYDGGRIKADRGIIYLSKVNPNDMEKEDRKGLSKLNCEFSNHYDSWFIIT